ncbi:MAG: hypothetical protein IPK26_29255 [Planctomycetes bacterium]|nr:hypothetical protein [Planctomycetota bacterium]
MRASILALVWLFTPSCMSLMSYDELRVEIDNVQRVEGSGQQQRLVWLEEADVAAWYCKWWPTSMLFSAKSPAKLENPRQHVRDLWELVLPEVADDLGRCADVLPRLLRIAELAPSPLDRIVALRGIETIARSLRLDLVAGLTEPAGQPAVPADLSTVLQAARELRPAARTIRGRELTPGEREVYLAAIGRLTAAPLPNWYDRVAWVEDLAHAWSTEDDDELRAGCEAALRTAIRFAVQWAVVTAMQGRERPLVDVRLCAIDILHRAGGVDSVPLLLALLAGTTDATASPSLPQYDADPVFRLRLIQLCGQLDVARARRVVRLPGRDQVLVLSPLDVLAQLVLNEDPYSSPLRLPAQAALAHCLQRPEVSYDLDWVDAWYREFMRQS